MFCDNPKPADTQPSGSYNFSPPPSYLQSFGDPRIHSEKEGDDEVFLRRPSERYVSYNKFNVIPVSEPYEQPVDSTLTETARYVGY